MAGGIGEKFTTYRTCLDGWMQSLNGSGWHLRKRKKRVSSRWSWKQAVADRILQLANERQSLAFTLQDIYAAEETFAKQFPENQHVRPKLRQTLQRLRDIGFVEFTDNGGEYRLDSSFDDLETTAAADDGGIVIPKTREVVRTIRLRNSLLSGDMKRRYENVCQVCRQTVKLALRSYSEAHHLQPIGSPHFGSDTEDNILVLCPNHHVMFDRGAIHLDAATLRVSHVCDAFEPRPLHRLDWHQLNLDYVQYYQRRIFQAA